MSVNLVNPTAEEEEEDNPSEDGSDAVSISVEDNQSYNVAVLNQFWPKVIEDIRNIETVDLKTPAMPLARIRKVMKLDEGVKIISSEAIHLFSKAVEIFTNELTFHAWVHTKNLRRRTLLKSDISMAVGKYDQFDFLVDIVPRLEVKKVTKVVPKEKNQTTLTPEQIQYLFHRGQQQQQTNNASPPNTGQTIQILQPVASPVVASGNGTQDPVVNIENVSSNTSNISTSTLNTVTGIQQPQIIQLPSNTHPLNTNATGVLQFVQQVMTATGEIRHIPVQLNTNQMLMLQSQVQNPSQTQEVQLIQSQPQIIQVASQTNGPTPVYIPELAENPSKSPE